MVTQARLNDFEQQQSQLLQTLYQTTLESAAWDTFLRQLVTISGSRSARILVMDRQAEKVLNSSKVNIDDDEHRRYVAHYVNRCPWRPELKQKLPGRLYNTHSDFSCDQQAFYRSEFFNDWARHLDIEHGLCGTVFQDSHYAVQLLVQRTGGQGAFDLGITQRINQLIPHVRQALQLSRQITREQTRQGLALRVSEQSFMPYLLVDGHGSLSYACPRAREILTRLPGVELTAQGLQFQCRHQQRRFCLSLQSVLKGPVAGQSADSSLTLINGALPVRLLVAPAEAPTAASTCRELWPSSAVATVFIQDSAEQLWVDECRLSQLFGLTPAEARVAAGVAMGQELRTLADLGGQSLHTLRTQLKVAMRKTGVCRQAELAVLVLRSAALRDRYDDVVPRVQSGSVPFG
ncbi:MAG: hypothetical protein EA349_11685 [Halomonadaceae bacterium]|nr:MAG: hypothetical protein EA349_11685 [Halomonadaceae bacterium]